MPTTNYRVSLAFRQLPDAALIDFTNGVITGMRAGGLFPTPPITTTILEEQNDDFAAKLALTGPGTPQATAEKNLARATLLASLRQNASYVQTLAGTNLPLLLASGFTAASTNRASEPLPQPVVLSVENFQSTMLLLRLKSQANARAFEVRVKTGPGDWRSGGVHTQARRILIEDLTPGALYEIQVRAVGGSARYSDWSDPVSHMAL